MSTTTNIQVLSEQAAAAIESGDPADAKRFAQAAGMQPSDFQSHLRTHGEAQLERTIEGRLYVAATLGSVTVHNWVGVSASDAYDHTQSGNAVKDGDVLNLGAGNVAIMVKAWPTVLHGEIAGFHGLTGNTPFEELDGGRYAASVAKAREAMVIGSSFEHAKALGLRAYEAMQPGDRSVAARFEQELGVSPVYAYDELVAGRQDDLLVQVAAHQRVQAEKMEIASEERSASRDAALGIAVTSLHLTVDGLDEEGNFAGDGNKAPFVVFDVDRQENVAGPFLSREEAGAHRLDMLAGKPPRLDTQALTRMLDGAEAQAAVGGRYTVKEQDAGNDQWAVYDKLTNKYWSHDGWQQPDAGLASMLDHREALGMVSELNSQEPGKLQVKEQGAAQDRYTIKPLQLHESVFSHGIFDQTTGQRIHTGGQGDCTTMTTLLNQAFERGAASSSDLSLKVSPEEKTLICDALGMHRELLASPTYVDREVNGNAWADKRIQACDGLLEKLEPAKPTKTRDDSPSPGM